MKTKHIPFKEWLAIKITEVTNNIADIDSVDAKIQGMTSLSIYSGDKEKASKYVTGQRAYLMRELEAYKQHLSDISFKKYIKKELVRFVIIKNDTDISKHDIHNLWPMMLVHNILRSNELYTLNYSSYAVFITTGILSEKEIECIKFCIDHRFNTYDKVAFYSWDGEDIKQISTDRYAKNIKITNLDQS